MSQSKKLSRPTPSFNPNANLDAYESPYFTNTHINESPTSSRTKQKQANNPNINSSQKMIEELNNNNQNAYSSRRSNSKAKSQYAYNYSKSNNSAYTTTIKQRIEKACLTTNTNDLQKQNILLTRELERLQKELLKKDQQLLQARTQVLPAKQSKTQLLQLYKTLNFYEGKIKEQESEIYKFRELILKAPPEGVTLESLNVMFEELRRDNEQLSARSQRAEFVMEVIQGNYKRIKNKYYQVKRQLAQYKRYENSPIFQYYLAKSQDMPYNYPKNSNSKYPKFITGLLAKANSPASIGQSSLLQKQQQILFKQLEQKAQQSDRQIELLHVQLQKLSNQFEKCKIENEILKNEIDEKNNQNTMLFTDYMQLKKSLRKIQSQKYVGGIKAIGQSHSSSIKNINQKSTLDKNQKISSSLQNKNRQDYGSWQDHILNNRVKQGQKPGSDRHKLNQQSSNQPNKNWRHIMQHQDIKQTPKFISLGKI